MAGARTVRCSRVRYVLRLLKLQCGCRAPGLLLRRGHLLDKRATVRLLYRLHPSGISRVVVYQGTRPQGDCSGRRLRLRGGGLAEGRWNR